MIPLLGRAGTLRRVDTWKGSHRAWTSTLAGLMQHKPTEPWPLQVEFRETGKLQPSLLLGFTFYCCPFHGAQQEVFAYSAFHQEMLTDQHANRRTRGIAWHWHVSAPVVIGVNQGVCTFLALFFSSFSFLIGNTVYMAILMTGLEIPRM